MLINRLNAYILPGRAAHPAPGHEQAQAGEALGLGGIFLSERWETKELGAMTGALTQATSRVTLVAGLRSEEHTSELQSLMRISYAAFCLKKKNVTADKR